MPEPGAADGGLRPSNDRFSYPEGSSNRGGCGRGALGGKVVCEPSGSLEYGELGGKGRCPDPVPGDARPKKLMSGNCKENEMYLTGHSFRPRNVER
jgi:hypothetical protein